MTQVIDRTLLNFSASDVSLYGNSRPLNFGWTSGNDWVVDTGRQTFGLVDFSLGPLGAFKADAAVSFQFGLRLSAGLGGLGALDTEYEIAVDVEYDDFVVINKDPSEDIGFFDFTRTSVISASSESQGIGAAAVDDIEGVAEDDQPEIPLGVSLDVVLGASFELENISYKLPFSSTKKVDDFEIFSAENQTINLFKLDPGNAQQSFDLSDEISIVLRLPTGADTEGSSTGSTIVSDKGFSNNPFLAIEGDLDALLIKYLKGVPFIGQALAVLEKTVFLSEEIDVNDYIPFLPEEWFTLELTVVDLSAAAGLHVTEEVSVDIGYKDEENLPDFQLGGGTSIIDQAAGLLGLDGEDPGQSKTPNVNVVLRSDNGTPNNLLDDKIGRGSLGEKIYVAPPEAGTGTPGFVTVDAWFDVDSAKVSHSVGLGGKFSITLSVLQAAIGGKIGEKLGISFGPLYELVIPEDGLEVDLFNFFTRRFDVEGGSFDDLPTGTLTPGSEKESDWGYEPGAFNQETAQYQYYWTNVFPASGLDEADPESRKKTIAFAEANNQWISEVRTLLDPLYDDQGVAYTVILNSGNNGLWDPLFNIVLTPPADDLKVSDTVVLWTANGSGEAKVSLAFGYNNYVIAAPSEDDMVNGLDAEYVVTFYNNGWKTRKDLLTAGLGNIEVLNFFNRLDASTQTVGTGGFVYKPVYGQEKLDSILAPSIVGTTQNDIAVFFGEQDFRNNLDRGFNAPFYMDGGRDTGMLNPLDPGSTGAENTPITTGDVFLANFGASFGLSAVFWDMRAEELAEVAANGATVTQTFNGFSTDSFGVVTTQSATEVRSSGNFAGSRLEFREVGELAHTTIVRDFESFLIRFGNQADVVRTGTQGIELLEFKGGDDRLIITSDRFADRYLMGTGEDFVVLDRASVQTNVSDFEDHADFILGGAGVDEVLISQAEDAAPLGTIGQDGLVWTFVQNGVGGGSYYDTTDDAETLLFAHDQINGILGSKTDAFGALDGDGTSSILNEQTYVQIALLGAGSSGARIAADVETITVDGFDHHADLVFYTGGVAYTGGEMATGLDPVDVFVADFGQFEAEKTVNGVAPGGVNLNAARNGVVFADSFVGEFERFVVKGTSAADVLVGGAEQDYLDGGAGDDFLSGGANRADLKPDFLIGGTGDDVFVHTLGNLSVIYGDAFTETPAPNGIVDDDLLILQGGGETGTVDQGLAFQVVVTESETLDIESSVSFEDAKTAALLRLEAGVFGVAFGNSDDTAVIAIGIEHSNQQGSNAADDVLLYDGGSTYLGGERDDDADVFIANFADQVEGVELLIEDDPEGQGLLVLENGVVLGGVDRMIVTFGQGSDTVRGGALSDYIDGGAGNDVLNGAGGDDEIRGGADNDFIYWQGDSGQDLVDGGTGLDRLMVSNMDDNGVSFRAGGLTVDAVNSSGGFFTDAIITAGTTGTLIDELLDGVEQAAIWTIAVDGQFDKVDFSDIEAVDVQGSDAFDDAIYFQGGLLYAGGERGGDADLFFGDFSAETNDLTFRDLDARPGGNAGEAFYNIGNALGTQIGQFERFHVRTGSGEDSVEGGIFNDVFQTGAGDDTIIGSLGNDDVNGGAGDDLFTYIGGFDSFDGDAGDSDRLEISAQESGYTLQVFDAALFPTGAVIKASNPLGASAYRLSFIQMLNGNNQQSIEQRHDYGGLSYQNIEYVFTTGSGAGDVFLSGSRGGVISSDGGNDILISNGGDDFLIGGEGRDAYVFGENMGHDIIANEFSGINEVHFVGRNLADLNFQTDLTGNNLVISASPDNSVTITGYFAQSTNPQNFLFFADDTLEGTTFDASALSTTQPGGQQTGAQFFGTQGNDGFDQGTDKAEFFFGFAGDDVFKGSLGADLLDGSLGNDYVSYEDNDTAIVVDLRNLIAAVGGQAEGDIFASVEGVLGTVFDDGIHGNQSDNNLIGGAGADTLFGFEGDDILSGGADNDTFHGGTGNDLMFGGGGDDIWRQDGDADLGDDVIIGGAGDDEIKDLEGNNRITGGQGDDMVATGAGDDVYLFEGDADPDRDAPGNNGGEDTWFAGGGTDLADFSNFGAGIFAYTSDDTEQSGVVETSDLDTYDLLGDNRFLLTFTGLENLTGSEFDDQLWGSSGDNVIDGRAGDDILLGRAGLDTLIGGSGFDTVDYRLEGGINGVNVNLDTGVTFDSFGQRDTLIEIEALLGTEFGDTLIGSASDNRFTGYRGEDVISGADGIDTIDYSKEFGFSGVIADLEYNQISDTYGDFDRISGIENFILSDAADFFVGFDTSVNVEVGGGDDAVFGSSDDDIIIGGSGTNSIEGLGGNDTYIYRNGLEDIFDGGDDFDVLSLIESNVPVNVNIAEQVIYQFRSPRKMVEYSNVEQIVGSVYTDQMIGHNDDDILIGWSGNDRLEGGGANDTLFGNSDDDTLDGGAGDDEMHGGTGNDFARGGTDNDTYFYTGGVDRVLGDEGTDTLSLEALDFAIGVKADAGDVYDLATMAITDTPATRDINVQTGTIRLVDFSTMEHLIASEHDDIVDNVANVGRFERVDLLAGDDLLFSQGASGDLRGGDGFDVISYEKTGLTANSQGFEINLLSGKMTSLDEDAIAADTLSGFEGVIGTGGSDSFIGDSKDNYFVGLGGLDEFVGGAGSDTIDYSAETGTGPLLVNLFSSSVRDTFGNREFASQIENVIGTSMADFFVGSDADNRFEGGDGDDTIYGGQGNDTLLSGLGEDIVNGETGDDVMVHEGGLSSYDGGRGKDWIDLSLYGSAVRIALIDPSLIDLSLQGTVETSGTDALDSGAPLTRIANLTSVEHAAGSLFDDRIFGSGQANVLFGDAGDDTLTGYGSEDQFIGGDGFDIVDYSAEDGAFGINASLNLNGGTDSYGSTDAFESIEGLIGGNGSDTLSGGAGDNLLVGNSGNDVLLGGAGKDTLDYSRESGDNRVAVNLDLQQATDTFGFIDTIIGFETVIGTDRADALIGDAEDTTIIGGGGADTLGGGAGNDTLTGGADNDLFVITSRGANVIITDFTPDEDRLDLSDFDLGDVEQALAAARAEPDLTLSFAEGGSVTLRGLGLEALDQIDVILPALARPVLQASAGGGSVVGTERAEFVQGQDGTDTLNGGAGDDLLSGGLGDDDLDGGEGQDIVTYATATGGGVIVNLDTGESSGAEGMDTLTSIEGAVGTEAPDQFIGSRDPDFFSGLNGADVFLPGFGADVIETGAGADRVEGSGEELDGDRIRDFEAEDAIVVQAMKLDAAAVKVSAGSAIFEIDGDGDGVTDSRFTLDGDFSGQAFEVTSDGTDTTIALAGAGASQLSATGERFITTDGGENRVYGGLGDDVILSAGGADILSGGAGDDTLLGGNDDDILLGGLGNDTMTGGAGRDIFAIDASDFSAGFNSNFITDFTPGEDILELTGFGFNDFSGLSQQNVADGVLIVLGPGLISLNGLSLGDLGAVDVSFGDAGRSYGLVSTTVVHRLTEEADRFLTTDPAANEVRAGGGDDVVIGAGGADVIYGEAGGDVLLGGAGADILQGGAGFDTLTGGADADQFVFEAGEETDFGLDVITDFTVGEDVVVATGFGLNATSFDDFTVTTGGLTAQLAHNQIVVFQGITEVSELGDLTQVFDFG